LKKKSQKASSGDDDDKKDKSLSEELDAAYRLFQTTANRPAVRLASAHTKALLDKAKRDMRHRYISDEQLR
jgi:hypothetical protein